MYRDEEKTQNIPRIGVIGAGGVGGYLAAMLANRFDTVSVVARGKRGGAIREKGMILHGELNGEICAAPARVVSCAGELGEQDYLLVCVKNYSLEELIPQLKEIVTEHTVVVPVMNGADPGIRIREGLSAGLVLDAVIYIFAYAKDDFSIVEHGKQASLRIGLNRADQENPENREKLDRLCALMQEAGVRCQTADDIETEIWKKFIVNCALNVSTAYYDCTVEEIRTSRERTEEYETLAREAWTVGRARGVALDESHLQNVLDLFRKYEGGVSSSMQKDLHDGKKVELETFAGFVVREGERLGTDVPVTSRFYRGLLEKVK